GSDRREFNLVDLKSKYQATSAFSTDEIIHIGGPRWVFWPCLMQDATYCSFQAGFEYRNNRSK
ncbi:MAG: hypothetical protein V4719_01500, partial [Planctomycetota bacterium]